MDRGGHVREAGAHACVYRTRADVQAIARIHGDHADVLSIHGTPLRPVHHLGTVLGSAAEICDDPVDVHRVWRFLRARHGRRADLRG